MKAIIKNPVTSNPWTPDMPNNFRGSEFASKVAKEITQDAKELKRRRTRKVSPKLQQAKIYTDQLVPLYPFLTKTQVRAAITLASNNLHQSRLILDLANKFLTVPPLNLALNYHPKKPVNTSKAGTAKVKFSPAITSICDKKMFNCCNSASPGISKNKRGNKIFGSDQNKAGTSTDNSTSGLSSSLADHNDSTTVTDNSTASVYDFSESEAEAEPIQSWSSHKADYDKKKIGVAIIRSQKGYRAFLL